MLDKLLSLDTQLFVYLNGLGSDTYDGLWLFITKQINWIPFFLLLFYIIYKKIGRRQTLYVLLFIAVLILITDQCTNLFKYTVQRLRPCNNPDIKDIIRIVQSRSSFSFFSGHAANSMAAAMFIYLLLKPYLKFDLVFIDADKENYLNYFELIVPKMNKGGIILSDNVLWSGKVLEPLNPKDISTKVLLEYNQLLKEDPRVETVLLLIRDGLTVSRVL